MKKFLKIILLIIFVSLISFIVYRKIKLPSFFKDEYYIVNLNNTDKILSRKDEDNIKVFLELNKYNIKNIDNISISKLAYQTPFRHEGSCYIFFKTDVDERLPFTLVKVTKNYKEYMIQHICMETGICKEYKIIRKVVTDNYKWWENNEKIINYERLEEPNRTEEKDRLYEENYEIVSYKNLFGKIVDITDKYLKIEQENNIKLVSIDWKKSNFTDYRTKDSLTIYKLKEGDYFYNGQIIKNITAPELDKINSANKINIESNSQIKEVEQPKIIDITYNILNEQCSYSGNITEIDENTIFFESYNNIYKINYSKDIELLDGRTEEKINFNNIKENDYIRCQNFSNEKTIIIATNKTGYELKKDLIKNMSLENPKNAFVNTPTITNLDIIHSEKAIMTIEIQDIYDLGNNETFSFDVILDSNTKITSKGNKTYNIETLNNSLYDIITIILDKNTLNDEIPRVSVFSSSDS